MEPSFYDPAGATYHKDDKRHCVDKRTMYPDANGDIQSPHLPLFGVHDDYGPHSGQWDAFSAKDTFPQRRPPPLNERTGQSEVGVIRLDDIELINSGDLLLEPASYIFSIMYVMGVFSLFLMYAPGVGQREGTKPAWNRMKQTLISGKVIFPKPRGIKRGGQSVTIDAGGTAPLLANQSGSLNGDVPTTSRTSRQGLTLQEQPKLMTCMTSISASESANIVLRNALGKIAANLQLMIQMGDKPNSQLIVLDLNIDEGHRLGIYYLWKTICLVFYICIPKQHGLRIIAQWLKNMNKCKGAMDTDKFDKTDLFSAELLDEKVAKRSEIKLLHIVMKLVKVCRPAPCHRNSTMRRLPGAPASTRDHHLNQPPCRSSTNSPSLSICSTRC